MYKRYVFGACALIGFLIGRQFGAGTLSTYASIMVAYHLYLVFLVVRKERKSGMKLPFTGRTVLIHLACMAPLVALASARPYMPVFALIRLATLCMAILEARWLFRIHVKLAAEQSARMLKTITGTSAATASVEAPPAPVVASTVTAASVEVKVAATVAVIETDVPAALTTAISAPAVSAATVTATAVIAPAPVEAVPVVAQTVRLAAAPQIPVATFSFAETKPSAPLPVHTCGDEYDEFVKHMQQGKRPFRKPGVSVKEEFELWLAARSRSASSPPQPQPSGLSRLLQAVAPQSKTETARGA